MSLLSKLTRPHVPRAACLLDAGECAVAEVRRRADRFALEAAARDTIPEGLLAPSFDERNILNMDALAEAVDATVRRAGLGRRQRWSLLLPEAAVKSLVVSFETTPASRAELTEMLNWKIERMVGMPASDLRISRQFVGAGGTPRFLAVAGLATVLDEYEALVATLGWQVGLLVPRYFGEAAWFDWDTGPGDKLLIGSRGPMMTAAVVRDGELILVRTLDGDPSRFADEIYRLALFYRDRVADSPEEAWVSKVLIHGPVDGARVAATVADAIGHEPAIYSPYPEALDVDASSLLEPGLLAAAGMATQHWSEH